MKNNPVIKSVIESLKNHKTKQAYPEWSKEDIISDIRLQGDKEEAFIRNWTASSGKVASSFDELCEKIKEVGTNVYCQESLLDTYGKKLEEKGFKIFTSFNKENADEAGVAITKASYGCVETGSIVLTEADTKNRLSTIAPWMHIAVVDKNTLVDTLFEVTEKLADNNYAIIVSGPSRTADVEGILIEGVHGPCLQYLILE